jgi:hypothetical protein
MNWAVPTIQGIQRTTALVVVAAAGVLLAADSTRAAAACLVGGGLMMANLYLLAVIGRMIVGLAQGGAMVRVGALIAPFKMLILGVAAYWLVVWVQVDGLGFCVGVAAQIAAILLETVWVALRARPLLAEEGKV